MQEQAEQFVKRLGGKPQPPPKPTEGEGVAPEKVKRGRKGPKPPDWNGRLPGEPGYGDPRGSIL
jgi:hypothetical protein